MLGIYTILHDFTFFGVKSNSAIVLHLQTDKPLSWLLYCAIDLSTSKVWHYDKILLDRKRTGFVKSCFVQSSPFDWSSVSKSTCSCKHASMHRSAKFACITSHKQCRIPQKLKDALCQSSEDFGLGFHQLIVQIVAIVMLHESHRRF